MGEWQLKDSDELEFAVDVGLFTPTEARSVHDAAASAVDDMVNRRWPFDDASWDWPVPPPLLVPTMLPEGWGNP